MITISSMPLDLPTVRHILRDILRIPSGISAIVNTILDEIEARRNGILPKSNIDLDLAWTEIQRQYPATTKRNEVLALLIDELAGLRSRETVLRPAPKVSPFIGIEGIGNGG